MSRVASRCGSVGSEIAWPNSTMATTKAHVVQTTPRAYRTPARTPAGLARSTVCSVNITGLIAPPSPSGITTASAASTERSHLLERGGEVTKRGGLRDDPHPAEPVGLLGDRGHHLDRIV